MSIADRVEMWFSMCMRGFRITSMYLCPARQAGAVTGGITLAASCVTCMVRVVMRVVVCCGAAWTGMKRRSPRRVGCFTRGVPLADRAPALRATRKDFAQGLHETRRARARARAAGAGQDRPCFAQVNPWAGSRVNQQSRQQRPPSAVQARWRCRPRWPMSGGQGLVQCCNRAPCERRQSGVNRARCRALAGPPRRREAGLRGMGWLKPRA